MEIKANFSNPEYSDRYSIKPVISCIIAGVQVISITVDFCMRLVNIDSVHTLDVIVMLTSWVLFCQIILTLLAPVYYTRPVVYIPVADLAKYCTIDEKAVTKTRVTIANFILYRCRKLWLALLCLPVIAMLAILLFISRDNVFLCELSAICVALLLVSAITHFVVHARAVRFTLGFLIFVSFFFLIIKSCFVTTVEQRYTDTASWLPRI